MLKPFPLPLILAGFIAAPLGGSFLGDGDIYQKVADWLEDKAEGDAPVDPACIRWKPASGGEEWLTDAFTSGGPMSPYVWSPTESGMLEVCPGTFFARVACAAEGAPIDIQVVGADRTTTTLDGGLVGPIVSIEGCTGRLQNFTLTSGNQPGAGGAAVVAPGAGQSFQLVELIFEGNLSRTSGGALSTGAGDVLVQSVDFLGNEAPSGGAIAATGTQLRLVDVEFHDNLATGTDGGALLATGGSVDVTDVLALGNRAEGSGGAFFIEGAEVELQNITFEANEAGAGDGGGAVLDGGSAFILDVRAFDNTATGEGGAFRFVGTSAYVQNSTFRGNVAGVHGGAFGLSDGALVTNLDVRWFANDSGDWGGAIRGDATCVFTGQNCDFGGNDPDTVFWETYTYSGWGENMHFACEGDDCDPCDEWRFYKDTDGDGYGDTDDWMEGCGPAPGYVADPGDCDEGDVAIHPGVADVCDGIDNDCDLSLDEDTTDFFSDGDGDGFGLPGSATCVNNGAPAPAGAVTDDTDCDDGDATTNPGAPEVCDGADNDCDALADEGLTCP